LEFTNKGRYEVFKSIYRENKRHRELEKELDIPGSEISRSIKRLVSKNLITKTIDNEYEITSIGKILYEVLNVFESTLHYEEFLNNHDINSIPFELLINLGKLKTVKIYNQTMKNIQLWSELVKNSEKFILAISNQFQDSILPIVERKISNQSIKVKTLIEQAVLMDSVKVGEQFKDRHAFYDKINVSQNVKVLQKVNLSLISSDKGAILFLTKEGKIDYSQCLFDNEDTFITWTMQIFDWYWEKGKDLKAFLKNQK
jgi:predicted transcriptional regulator